MSHRPAGGLKSKNITERPVRVGPGARAIDKNWVAQIGSSQGNHATMKSKILPDHRADPYGGPSFRPAPMGSTVAAQTVCGPGGSRTVMRSGQQGTHGNVNPGDPRPTRRSVADIMARGSRR
jgi:hypothetical protein